MAPEAWYEAAFARGYLDVYPHRDQAAAEAEVAGLLGQGFGGRVLDLGCGFGRHTLALRRRGVQAFGLDLSLDLLRAAREREGAVETAGRLARGDFRRLPFRDAAFDGVAMLFSSFGYFDEEENGLVLDEVARVLADGGLFVLDLMNPARIRSSLVPLSRTERDGLLLIERRALADEGRRVTKHVRCVRPDGAEESWHEDVRLFEPSEIRELLERRGLSVQRTVGDFDGRPFTDGQDDAPRQIVWARRERAG